MIQKVLPMYLNRSVTYVYTSYRGPFLWFVSLGKQRNEHTYFIRRQANRLIQP